MSLVPCETFPIRIILSYNHDCRGINLGLFLVFVARVFHDEPGPLICKGLFSSVRLKSESNFHNETGIPRNSFRWLNCNANIAMPEVRVLAEEGHVLVGLRSESQSRFSLSITKEAVRRVGLKQNGPAGAKVDLQRVTE